MFRALINDTPFVDEIANSVFSHVRGETFHGDNSFVSTLRALVSPRMAPDDDIYLRFGSSTYTTSQVNTNPIRSMIGAICSDFNSKESGTIYVHNMAGTSQEDNYSCLELIKSSFCDVYEGWSRLEKITTFYAKQFFVLCFINPELKSVAIFSDRLDSRRLHYLQCSILAFLPWYFDPQKGIDEEEMALIVSLREKTPDKYREAIAAIAKRYDFRAEKIKRLLAGFETKYERQELEKVRRNITNIIEKINSLNSDIGRYLNDKNGLETTLLGLEKKIHNNSNDSEIMEYFLCNDKLTLYSVDDERIVFAVKSYLTYFDEELALSAINNKQSYIYDLDDAECDTDISDKQMEKLMRAVFIDQILKIKVCAAYEFDLNGTVYAKYNFDFGCGFGDCLPNPHIDDYRCMGNYHQVINTLLMDRNYISAIEQCIASSQSLNFGDSTVMQAFMFNLYGVEDDDHSLKNNKCIELPDGRVVTPTVAIEWITEQEHTNTERERVENEQNN